MDALFDSGSPVSFIDRQFLSQLCSTVSYNTVHNQFVSVDGRTFSAVGSVSLPVVFQEKCVHQTFYIIESPISVILGVDAMRALRVTLDFTSAEIVINAALDVSMAPHLSDDDFLKLFALDKTFQYGSFLSFANYF